MTQRVVQSLRDLRGDLLERRPDLRQVLLLEAVDPVAAPAAEGLDDPHAGVERRRVAGSWPRSRGSGSSPPPRTSAGRIGFSLNLSNSQSYFFVHARSCASVSGEWPADQNEVARSRPPWQGVQPKVVAGCMDSLPTIRWMRGCVRKTGLDLRVLEALAVGADVAGRAAVDLRDLHEVDVDELVGQLHLLDAQRRVDHVEDRRVAQLEERVLLQARVLLRASRKSAVFFSIVVSISVFFALIAVDLGLRVGLLLLELRQVHRPLVELLDDRVERLLDRRRRLRRVRERVLVLVALRVEGGLGELVLLVGEVDLRVEVLQLRLELARAAPAAWPPRRAPP